MINSLSLSKASSLFLFFKACSTSLEFHVCSWATFCSVCTLSLIQASFEIISSTITYMMQVIQCYRKLPLLSISIRFLEKMKPVWTKTSTNSVKKRLSFLMAGITPFPIRQTVGWNFPNTSFVLKCTFDEIMSTNEQVSSLNCPHINRLARINFARLLHTYWRWHPPNFVWLLHTYWRSHPPNCVWLLHTYWRSHPPNFVWLLHTYWRSHPPNFIWLLHAY